MYNTVSKVKHSLYGTTKTAWKFLWTDRQHIYSYQTQLPVLCVRMIVASVRGTQNFPKFIKQFTNSSVRKVKCLTLITQHTHIGPKPGANDLLVVVNWHPGMRTAGFIVRIVGMLLTRPTVRHLLTGANCEFGNNENLKFVICQFLILPKSNEKLSCSWHENLV